MQSKLNTTPRLAACIQSSASRQNPRHVKFMLHAPHSSFTSTLRTPLSSGLVHITSTKTPNTLALCTAPSQTDFEPVAAAEDSSLATTTLETPAQPTSPLYPSTFDAMYAQLSIWRATYRTTIVPRNAHDAGDLGDWVAAIRRLHRKDTLPFWAIEKLNELDMNWKVDVLTAKWHANFHTTREFKEVHGGDECDLDTALPSDYGSRKKKKKNNKEGQVEEEVESNEEEKEVVVARADFIEAARWLERQRELFLKEKLTDYRVWALKRLLGIRLRREYAPRRKNMHPSLLKQNAAFKKLVAKDEAKAAKAIVEGGGELEVEAEE